MSEGAIRNWAFIAFAIVGLVLYFLGRLDQRRADVKQFQVLRGQVRLYRKLASTVADDE